MHDLMQSFLLTCGQICEHQRLRSFHNGYLYGTEGSQDIYQQMIADSLRTRLCRVTEVAMWRHVRWHARICQVSAAVFVLIRLNGVVEQFTDFAVPRTWIGETAPTALTGALSDLA
jgi:hypothetical protein